MQWYLKSFDIDVEVDIAIEHLKLFDFSNNAHKRGITVMERVAQHIYLEWSLLCLHYQ
jgi:hypothetical protein